MITYTGVHIQKIGGAAGVPTPTDIAVHAGRICRFVGAVWYPNLAHFVFVGLLAYKRSRSLPTFVWGILHDAHETATGDTPRPFKCDCMRVEQHAIDIRLLSRYLPCSWCKTDGAPVHSSVSDALVHPATKVGRVICTATYGIDFDVIKSCDRDACDIEAVECGLPNYGEISRIHDERAGRDIHALPSDIALFRRVRGAFGGFETVQGEESSAVQGLVRLISAFEENDVEAIARWLASWGTEWLDEEPKSYEAHVAEIAKEASA